MPLSHVYNTDCLEYMRSLPDNAFDLAIADPPYGLDKEYFDKGCERFDRECHGITVSVTGRIAIQTDLFST